MKNIVLATDFSKTSVEAIKSAVQVFSIHEYEYTLFHCRNVSVLNTGEYLYQESMKLKTDLPDELVKLEKDLILANPGITINTSMATGEFKEELKELIEHKDNTALIVLGKNKMSKIESWLFGSQSIDLINDSNIPMLIVPEDVELINPRRILIATDLKTQPNEEDLKELVNLSEHAGADIYSLNVCQDMQPTLSEKSAALELKQNFKNNTFHQLFVYEENIEDSILQFAQENRIDMIVLISRHKSQFERLFQQNYTRKISRNASCPIYILNGS